MVAPSMAATQRSTGACVRSAAAVSVVSAVLAFDRPLSNEPCTQSVIGGRDCEGVGVIDAVADGVAVALGLAPVDSVADGEEVPLGDWLDEGVVDGVTGIHNVPAPAGLPSHGTASDNV